MVKDQNSSHVVEDKSLLHVIKDINNNLKCCPWILFMLCALVGIILYFLNPIADATKSSTLDTFLTITSGLLGFMLASIAIFFGLGKEVISKMYQTADDGRKPFDVVISTIVFLNIVLIAVILMIIVCQLLNQEAALYQVFYYSSLCFTFYSLCLCGHIVFNLFTLRTFLEK